MKLCFMVQNETLFITVQPINITNLKFSELAGNFQFLKKNLHKMILKMLWFLMVIHHLVTLQMVSVNRAQIFRIPLFGLVMTFASFLE